MGNNTWQKEANYQIKKKSQALEKGKTYIYLWILEAVTIKQVEMKEKN